jgi:4-amino-4-deoxy-L-arabinose transferase-like glycosyltransferase
MPSGSERSRASKRAARSAASPRPKTRAKLSNRATWTILAIILIIAASLRFYGLEAAPPGLYIDEAADGANAVQAWETGDFRVFYPEDNGREGLYTNVASVFIHFLGSNARALRLPAAVFGFLTVAGLYALTLELISAPAALAAAFFLATSYWHLNFSRIAFRAIAAPCFLTWSLYLLLLAFRRRRSGVDFAVWASLAGVLYGLGFDTYIAYRITPILVILILGFLLAQARWAGQLRRYWIAAGLFIMGTTLTGYPLLTYLLNHPGMATNRVNQVSILDSPNLEQDIETNVWETVGMVYSQGDTNPRHNYPGRPEVFWPVSILMTLGIFISLWKMFTRWSLAAWLPAMLLLTWVVCGAVPAVLSNEGLPHALRSILMLPPIMILAGIGAAATVSYLGRGIPVPAIWGALIVLAAVLVGETGSTYFRLWARDPLTRHSFNEKEVRLATDINSLPAGQPKVVAIQGPIEASDPFYPPLLPLRFLTKSVTAQQQQKMNLRFYTPLTFPAPLPKESKDGAFCAQAKAALPHTIVVCVAL